MQRSKHGGAIPRPLPCRRADVRVPTVTPRSGRVVVNRRWRMAAAEGATLGRDDAAPARSESAHMPDPCLPVTLSKSWTPHLYGQRPADCRLAARTVRTTSETEASYE